MAEKQPYPPPQNPQGQPPPPGYGAPPPPYQEQASGPVYAGPPPSYPSQMQHQVVAGGTTIIVQQGPTRPAAPPPKQKKGLFGSLMKEVDKVASTVTNEINDLVGQNTTGAILNQFQTGNVVQLVSRTSGRSLQVVAAVNGQLVVDGAGPTQGQPPFNAVWTVVAEGKNQIRLHNNNNFLTIINGQTALINMPPGTVQGIETKLQLHLMSGQYVIIESMKEQGRYVGVMPDGSLKPASSTGREINSHFAVKLVYSPYAAVTSTVPPK
ncbi:uncharacterized protein LOC121386749 [Gigantopelta aegis]|uniref:uncharacterized protein LOC121386749 n=1 Tax=Gigantopelta aegis TaxID=1735272 RepID=UPI001B88AC8F|nr:uncharacterized protein LOC121386749 [Gigantopelta aegis]XP_041373686.1 uncharacterized protein LOC121386749 [Gigantopelta aegis]